MNACTNPHDSKLRPTQTAFRLDPGLLDAAKRLARVRRATLTAIVKCALISEIEGMSDSERTAYDALLANEAAP